MRSFFQEDSGLRIRDKVELNDYCAGLNENFWSQERRRNGWSPSLDLDFGFGLSSQYRSGWPPAPPFVVYTASRNCRGCCKPLSFPLFSLSLSYSLPRLRVPALHSALSLALTYPCLLLLREVVQQIHLPAQVDRRARSPRAEPALQLGRRGGGDPACRGLSEVLQ